MTKTMARAKLRTLATAAAAALAVAAMTGCKSSGEREVQVDEPTDLAGHNRLVVRMALAENVYNGIAVEKAVYPKDFDHAHATFNELGTRRMETLVDVLRGGKGRVVVVRGDAPEELYAQRVAAVREQLADAGLDAEEITVARDIHVGGATSSSERALLTFDKMMATYAPQQQGAGPAASGAANMQGSTDWSGSRNRGK